MIPGVISGVISPSEKAREKGEREQEREREMSRVIGFPGIRRLRPDLPYGRHDPDDEDDEDDEEHDEPQQPWRMLIVKRPKKNDSASGSGLSADMEDVGLAGFCLLDDTKVSDASELFRFALRVREDGASAASQSGDGALVSGLPPWSLVDLDCRAASGLSKVESVPILRAYHNGLVHDDAEKRTWVIQNLQDLQAFREDVKQFRNVFAPRARKIVGREPANDALLLDDTVDFANETLVVKLGQRALEQVLRTDSGDILCFWRWDWWKHTSVAYGAAVIPKVASDRVKFCDAYIAPPRDRVRLTLRPMALNHAVSRGRRRAPPGGFGPPPRRLAPPQVATERKENKTRKVRLPLRRSERLMQKAKLSRREKNKVSAAT